MQINKLNSLIKRLKSKKLSNKKKKKYMRKINMLEENEIKEVKYMNYEFIEKSKNVNTAIEIGDILICKDKDKTQIFLVIHNYGRVSVVNLSTYTNEYNSSYLSELYNTIKHTYIIKDIIKKDDALLQLKK